MRPAWIAVLLVVPLSGCNVFDKGTRARVSYYTLSEFAPSSVEPGDSRHLAVEAFTSARHLDDLQIHRRPVEGPTYHLYPEHHRWGALPSAMATETAIAILRSRFRTVTSYPSTDRPDLILSLRLVRFEEVRAEGSATGEAVVAVEGELSSVGTGATATRVHAEERAPVSHADGDSVDGAALIAGLRQALEAALAKVVGQSQAP